MITPFEIGRTLADNLRSVKEGAALAVAFDVVVGDAVSPMALRRRSDAELLGRVLEDGETLFDEGALCTGLFIVSAGRIEVRQMSVRGREQVFHTEGPGATLGEGPLFAGSTAGLRRGRRPRREIVIGVT